MSDCRCGRETRDDAYVCEACGDQLAQALGDIAWLAEEMETTITGQRGVDYRTLGAARSTERPSPVPWTSAEARTHLRALLVSWVRFCAEEGVRHQERSDDFPADDITSMSRWLLWRVDGLMLDEIGPEAVDEITSAVAHCHRIIDRPPERQYLGRCAQCESGRLYARPSSDWAKCEECGTHVRASDLREGLLRELDDRLCTAAEIARLSTYLGLKADREQVRKRINTWAKRGLLDEHASLTTDPTFRFGAVYVRLVGEEYRPAAS